MALTKKSLRRFAALFCFLLRIILNKCKLCIKGKWRPFIFLKSIRQLIFKYIMRGEKNKSEGRTLMRYTTKERKKKMRDGSLTRFFPQRISSAQQVAAWSIGSGVVGGGGVGFKCNAAADRAALSSSESLRSGWGLFLVGRVWLREPPLANSSRSFEFLHFIRRFWNQIFTYLICPIKDYIHGK